MSGIASSVKLNDQFTPTLKRIEKNLDKLISSFSKLESTVTKVMSKTTQASNKTAQAVNRTALQEERLKKAVEQTNAARLKSQTQAQKLAREEARTKQVMDRINASQQKINNSMRRGAGLASNLGNTLKTALGAYLGVQGVSKVIGLADNLQMTTNRLDLLNDGKQSTEELKQKIYESAMRSRADYLGTADSVAKMGLRTGDTFKNMDELIAFNETLNKMYAIAGTGAHEQFGATLQLIQALGSGVLRGQEFNAVFEAAPNVLQAVADHMNVPVEKLREMAEDGAITADIIKNAMFEAAEETNEKFKALQYTFGHVWTGLKNSAIHSFQPVLKQISNITSSERWIKFIDGVGVAIDKLAIVSSKVLGVITKVVSVIFDSWGIIEPILMGIAIAYIPAICLGLINMAKNAWATIAPWLAANWAILLVGAAIGVVILIAKKMGVTFGDVVGYICGCFEVLKAVFHNVGVWFNNLWVDAKIGFYKFINEVLNKLSSLAQKIQPLASLLDVDLSGMIGNAKSEIEGKITSLEGQKQDYTGIGDAWERGKANGKSWVGKMNDTLSDVMDKLGFDFSGTGSDAGKYLSGAFADNPALDGILKNTKDIANNTSTLNDEDLSYMRDMATRQAIDRHTTRNVTINMTNNNNISKDADADGILDKIKRVLYEEATVNASGVHY